uniref:Uncharacterized protein n=1 Tax=Arundo donax TaxID=35708 RepID=A0A0A9EJD2_ARUDO
MLMSHKNFCYRPLTPVLLGSVHCGQFGNAYFNLLRWLFRKVSNYLFLSSLMMCSVATVEKITVELVYFLFVSL